MFILWPLSPGALWCSSGWGLYLLFRLPPLFLSICGLPLIPMEFSNSENVIIVLLPLPSGSNPHFLGGIWALLPYGLGSFLGWPAIPCPLILSFGPAACHGLDIVLLDHLRGWPCLYVVLPVQSSSSISFPTYIPPPFLVLLCSGAPYQANFSALWSDGYRSLFTLISMTQQYWCLTCSRHTKKCF